MKGYIIIGHFDGTSDAHYNTIYLNEAKANSECIKQNNKLSEFDKSWGMAYTIETIEVIE